MSTFSFRFSPCFFLVLTMIVPAGAQTPNAAPPTRDLVISNWEAGRFALYPGMTIQRNVGKTPSGEPLSRITLATGQGEEEALTQINLPATATDHDLSCFLHKTDLGAGSHVALFQERAHGWGTNGNVQWGLSGDATYQTHVPNAKNGWDWKVGFFQSSVGPPPYWFRGFKFGSRNAKDAAGKTVTVEAGPIHVAYTPDDAHWLYTDLQPKTIPSRDGVLPPLVLRVANLGTTARTFRLVARPIERNLTPTQTPAVALGTVTLAPGELKEVPIHLPLSLLGRYTLRYHAEGKDGADTNEETVSVVNARDMADGFRHWAARRQWFSAPQRRPLASDDPKKGKVTLSVANNGLSPVPLFPVEARTARPSILLPKDLAAQSKAPLTVLNTQLSPAWLVQSTDAQMQLFGEMRRQGLGGPSHLAFATATGTRIIKPGEHLTAADLQGMTQPWLLAWWQGSDGWTQWDAPYLVSLQHRPMQLDFTATGVSLRFAQAAGYVATMPLFGYAKLPQQSAWAQKPDGFRMPADRPAAQWQTWTWDAAVPAVVVARCDWWARALTRVPYNVRESYQINHQNGSVDVHDAFDYVAVKNDWNTLPLLLAPLSPTLAVALKGGFPMTVAGKLTDAQCPTMFGPYSAVEGARDLRYSLHVGPYWMQTADLNLSVPADGSTPARRAQVELLSRAAGSDGDAQNQMWNWRDGNFVWYAQGQSNREPAMLNGYMAGGYREDAKGWMQARTLDTLLDPTRYQMDERSGIRRFINGPGIGDFGSGDWGDAGKLGTDMVYDVYTYAYNTGDYQTVADKWDIICSLNSLPTSQTWASQGRAAISEMGDQAPTQLALARLAYAVGDRETYAAAVYWWSRELVAQVVKEGALTKWREQWMPWNKPGVDPPTATGTNLWGTNAAWVNGGFHADTGGDQQWTQFYTRLDDPDTVRFLARYATELPRRVVEAASKTDFKNNYAVYFDRAVILGQDTAQAQADFVQADPKISAPNNFISLVSSAWREFPPKLETLIPATAPPISDANFAWDQMNYARYGLVSPGDMAAGRLPTPRWFWWHSPVSAPGVDQGDKWTFGSLGPAGLVPAKMVEQPLNASSVLDGFALRPSTPLDRLPTIIRALAEKAALPPGRQAEVADAWDAQSVIPVLVAGPFANPGGGANNALVHAPERAYLAGKLSVNDVYLDNAAPDDPKALSDAFKPGGTVHWQRASLSGTALDFLRLYPATQDKTAIAAYVALWVKSPSDQAIMIGSGSDDGIKIWVNGQAVYDHPGARGGGMDEDTPSARLKSGWNSVLVKVTQGNGGWDMNFRLASPDDLPLPGLEFSDAPH